MDTERSKRLYLIVGETASGKDTVAQILSQRLGIPIVVSYTDAPIRSDQAEGVSHYFLTKEEFDRILETGSVIAYTQIGASGYRYCATLEAIPGDRAIYVIDPNGIADMKARVNSLGLSVELVTIFIDVPRFIREHRAASRQGFDVQARIEREERQFERFRESCGWDIRVENFNKAPDDSVDEILESLRA